MKIDPFRLERYFAKHEFSAPYLPSSSDCESMSLGDLLSLESGAADQMLSLWLGYPEAPGNPQLRQAITTLYEDISTDHFSEILPAMKKGY